MFRSGRAYREVETACKYAIRIVDPAHGSELAAWDAMGKPVMRTLSQIAKLIEASKLAPPSEHALSEPIRMNPYEFALVTIRQQ